MVGWLCCGKRKESKQDYHKFDHHSQSPNVLNENNDKKANAKSTQTSLNTNSAVDSKQSSPNTNSVVASSDKPRVFNYRELATATRNFHPDSFLGEGGFGSVYKGTLRTNEVVAVKKLNPMGLQGEKEFLVEVLMLSLLRHPNLVNMIGYCAEGTQRLLVLEFMPLGSLETHLHDLPPGKDPLDWKTRMKIAAGSAKGVDYLHNEAKPPVIYRDLKPSNILLDEGYHPKLSDFGLAKFGPVGDNSHVSTRVMGTHGYCAPEYASTGRLTPKSDTFSFGVVLLELISGRKAVQIHPNGKRTSIVDWARPMLKDRKTQLQLVDPQLKGQFSVSAMRKAVEVAGMCIREDANTRPTMHEVALAMEYLTSQKNDHDPPRRSVSMGPSLPTDTKAKESPKILNLEVEREQAVAEAKLWGEQWREKRRQSESGGSDGVNSWVPKANDQET